MAKTPPTGVQLEVLQWIADGCPAGVMADPKFKVSAYALDHRNLVRVRRRRNPWIAEITEAGQQLLATRAAAAVPSPRHATSAPKPSSKDPRASVITTESAPLRERAPIPSAKSATQQMIDRLLVEHVIEFTSAEARRYNQLAAVARRKKLFPDDMEIIVSPRWSKLCTVELKRRPEWQLVALEPIAIPAALQSPHDVVAKLKEQRTDRLGMDKPRWSWTLRVIQGFVVEAERRGYRVVAPPAPKPDNYGYVSREKRAIGHIGVSIGEDEVHLQFSQSTKLVPHLLTAAERHRQEKGFRVSTEARLQTDFLTIRLTGLEPAFWQSDWTETEAARAESLLPRILQEIELRAARSVDRRHERQRRDDERRREWEGVRGRAIEHVIEDHRAQVLLDQAERFHRVQMLGDYTSAVRNHISTLDQADASAATAWLQWAESYADDINPLRGDIRIPDDPKPDPDALKPYMNGWSPYGPDRGIWG